MVKHLPPMWETWVQSLGQEDPLEKEMATHCGTLAWKIPWTEEPDRLQSMGSQSRTRLSNFTFFLFYTHIHVRVCVCVCVYMYSKHMCSLYGLFTLLTESNEERSQIMIQFIIFSFMVRTYISL